MHQCKQKAYLTIHLKYIPWLHLSSSFPHVCLNINNLANANYWLQCIWAPHYKDIELLEWDKKRAKELMKGLEHKWWRAAEGPGVISLEKRRLKGDSITLQVPEKGCTEVGVSLYLQVTKEEMDSSCGREGFWLFGEMFLLKALLSIETGCPRKWLNHHPWGY